MNSQYRILAISGSLRARSSNTEALRAAAMVAPPSVIITLFDGVASLPHFNPDQDAEGAVLPPAVQSFRAQVAAADGLIISSPEYAHGVPGSLKNALDWLVSGPEIPYKPVALLNTSPRSTHAHASLAETLRTMSTVSAGSIELPLGGRDLDASVIAGTPEFAGRLRAAIDALIGPMDAYRQRHAELFGPPASMS